MYIKKIHFMENSTRGNIQAFLRENANYIKTRSSSSFSRFTPRSLSLISIIINLAALYPCTEKYSGTELRNSSFILAKNWKFPKGPLLESYNPRSARIPPARADRQTDRRLEIKENTLTTLTPPRAMEICAV